MPHYAAYRPSGEWLLPAKDAAGLEINSVGKERCGVPSRPALALGWVVGKGGRRRLVPKRSARKGVIEPGAEAVYA